MHKRIRLFCMFLVGFMVFYHYSNTFLLIFAATKAGSGFIHTSGTKLLDGKEKEYIIKGIAFGNNVWSNPSIPPMNHHTESSYKELRDLGFNSVRFYLNYRIFEEDNKPYQYKKSGWDWLDKNIAWAKKYNMKLVLNMHYPQGGFQSNGNGMELWTKKDNQKRLIALWKEIAKRYKEEPVIAAFDLLNEPYVPEKSTEEATFQQWKSLAAKLVKAIRTVDKNHLIIVERLNASKNLTTGESNWTMDRNDDMNFFLIKDSNIAYEFHIYEPIEVTHQNAGWIESLKGNFGVYPNTEAIKTTGEVKWEGFTYSNPILNVNSSEWTYLEGKRFKVTDKDFKFAQPTFQAGSIGTGGTVWFDDIIIKEYDENSKLIREIKSYDFNEMKGMGFWQAGSSKGNGSFDAEIGYNSKGSIKISGTTDDANLSSYIDRIKLKQGYYYEISGYAKGENLNFSSQVRIRLDFYSCDAIYNMDKAYLELTVDKFLEFGKENKVPLYLGEFGCITYAFQENRGGDRWVLDMLDICMDQKISYNYHSYHEEAFGLYQNSASQFPSKPNELLMKVFKTKLK